MFKTVALLLGCALCAVSTTGFLSVVASTTAMAERPNLTPKPDNPNPPKPPSYGENCRGGRCGNPNPPPKPPKYENCGIVGPCPTPRPRPPVWEPCGKGGRCANPNPPRPRPPVWEQCGKGGGCANPNPPRPRPLSEWTGRPSRLRHPLTKQGGKTNLFPPWIRLGLCPCQATGEIFASLWRMRSISAPE